MLSEVKLAEFGLLNRTNLFTYINSIKLINVSAELFSSTTQILGLHVSHQPN